MVFETWGATIAELLGSRSGADLVGPELVARNSSGFFELLSAINSTVSFIFALIALFLVLLVGASIFFGFLALLIECVFYFIVRKSWLFTPEDQSAAQGLGALWAVAQATWPQNLITVVAFYAIRESSLAGDQQKLLFLLFCVLMCAVTIFMRSSLDEPSSFNGLGLGAKIFWLLFLLFDFGLFVMPFSEDSGLWLPPKGSAIFGLFFPVLFGHTVRQLMLRKSAS